MKKTLIFLFALITTLASAQLPQNGLMFHFPFNGSITDVGPNLFNANIINTSSGSVTLDSDRKNTPASCSYFAGGYLDLGLNDKMAVKDSSFTFVAWVCPTNSDLTTIYSNNIGFSYGLSIGMRNGCVYAAVCGGSMPNSISVNVAYDDNLKWYEWHHVAVVLNRSTNKFCIYVDGVKRPIANDTNYGPYGGSITNNELDFTGLPLNLNSMNTNAIGAYLANGRVYQNFLGLLDDIALYNRVLSENEITGFFLGTSTLHANTSKNSKRIFLDQTDGKVCIKGLDKDAELTVLDINGVIVTSSVGQTININALPKGIYIIKVKGGTTSFAEKFCKP